MKRSALTVAIMVIVILALAAMPVQAETTSDGCWGTTEAGVCTENQTIYETCVYYGKPHCAPVYVNGPVVTDCWVLGKQCG